MVVKNITTMETGSSHQMDIQVTALNIGYKQSIFKIIEYEQNKVIILLSTGTV